MPPINFMPILADLAFISKNKKLPLDWKDPKDEPAKSHYQKAFKDSEKNVPPEPMCYFFAATPNKYHVDACKEVGKQTKEFVHTALDQIKTAWTPWKAQAKFKDLKIMAVSAIGAPGCFDAPKIKDSMAAWVAKPNKDNEADYIQAVKDGLSEALEGYTSKVTVPGLPWYPAFAAFPGPQAPPMPNVPVPLIACVSAGMAKMTPTQIRDAMVKAFPQKKKQADKDKHYEAVFEAIATAVAVGFLIWVASQMVTNVLGKGPIPTFAPPYVPVGPVVGGDNIAIPGHIAT